jgi:tetratricopeptide (TPR) repeat protein
MILAAFALLLGSPDIIKSPNPQVARLAEQAEKARQEKRLDDAVRSYARAVELQPSWIDGWWALGTLYYEKDQYQECRDAFVRLTRLQPDSGPGFSMLGLCEFSIGKHTEALIHLQRARELGFGIDAVRQVAEGRLIELLTKAEFYEQALGIIAALAERQTPDARLINLAGLAGLQRPMLLSEVPAAEREVVTLAGTAFCSVAARNIAQAAQAFDKLLSKYPSAPGVHYLYGAFLLQNDPDKAITELETELRASPNHVATMTALAYEYLRRSDTEKGLPYAKRAVVLKPDAVAPHAILGRLLVLSGDIEGGVVELEAAKKIAPEDPQPRIALASVYAKLGRAEDAARERREFLRLTEKYKKASGSN